MSSKHGYQSIYNFLLKMLSEEATFATEDVVVATGLKIGSVRVYIRNKLINVYVRKNESGRFFVLSSLRGCSEREFIAYCSQRELFTKKKTQLEDDLLKNSIHSMLSAVEIHNKPLIQYRYQIVTILVINSWELALKAYIAKNLKHVKLRNDDGSTKPFEECVSCVVDTVGKDLFVLRENLTKIYDFRCKYIHFYHEGLDLILLSLIQKSIVLYSDFLSRFFDTKVSEVSDFHILPIGFNKPISPIDYLTNKSYSETSPQEVKDFIKSISDSITHLDQLGISEMILVPYSIAYKSESRLKNADIVAAINQNKNVNISITEEVVLSDDTAVKKVRIDEQRVIDEIFPLTYDDLIIGCKERITGFKKNKVFNDLLKRLKEDPNLHHVRRLNPRKPSSAKQDFYSPKMLSTIIAELSPHIAHEQKVEEN